MSLLKIMLSAYDIYSEKKFNLSQFKHKLVDIKHDVIYNQSTPDACKLSIYKNKTGIRHGTIINFHGGGLISYEKRTRRNFCTYLASKGYTVININYGLAPKYHISDQLYHCNTALQWVADNAQDLHLDINNMHIAGDGVGAWFARNMIHISENKDIARLAGDQPHPLKFATCAYFSGTFDLKNIIDKEKLPRLHAHMQRKLIKTLLVEKYAVLNATRLVPAYALPTYVLHTTHDVVPASQSTKLVELIQNNGNPVWEFKAVKHKAEHNFQLNTTNKFGEHAIQSYIRFLQEQSTGNISSRYIEI